MPGSRPVSASPIAGPSTVDIGSDPSLKNPSTEAMSGSAVEVGSFATTEAAPGDDSLTSSGPVSSPFAWDRSVVRPLQIVAFRPSGRQGRLILA
jgi:hypothetical protein